MFFKPVPKKAAGKPKESAGKAKEAIEPEVKKPKSTRKPKNKKVESEV
jgi:hypothetical protein